MNDRSNPIQVGLVGVTLAIAIVLATLQYDRLPFLHGGTLFGAHFTDAGGLLPGDRVEIAGIKAGTVEDVALDGAQVLVRFRIDESIVLGEKTSAAIKTNTVLGRKSLEVTPGGDGALTVDQPIPTARTTSPYSLNDALSDLAGTTRELDTDRVDASLDALSAAFADTPGPLRAALDGVTTLSKSINARDDALRELLVKAQGVTKVLAERGAQINALLVDGNELLGELSRRRAAIAQLIVNVQAVATQLSGFVADNEAQLKPALDQLNSVLALLQKNKANIAAALDGLGPFAAALGEQVGSGPYFQALVSNVDSTTLRPLVDALVWPQRLPESLREYFGNGPQLHTRPTPP